METVLTQRTKGLSTSQLKMIALVLMVLDHIHFFFGFTGAIPDWFSMLGRLSAPLFWFCLAEGFHYTHDRRSYFKRIYLIAAAMGALQCVMAFGLVRRPDGFYPYNAAMSNFVIAMVMWQGIDWLREKRIARGLAALLLPLAAPILLSLLALAVPALGVPLTVAGFTVLPMWNFIADGGIWAIVPGTVLYLLRGHRRAQAIAFAVTILLLDGGLALAAIQIEGAPWTAFFTDYFEWMEVFAVIPMLCYNGTRGKAKKEIFYWFYPAHIYVLFALSWLLYAWMNR